MNGSNNSIADSHVPVCQESGTSTTNDEGETNRTNSAFTCTEATEPDMNTPIPNSNINNVGEENQDNVNNETNAVNIDVEFNSSAEPDHDTNKHNGPSEIHNATVDAQLLEQLKKQLEEANDKIQHLERVTTQQGLVNSDLNARYQNLIKSYETLKKEKDTMVMKYATSEKKIIDERQLREQTEKKYQKSSQENEILNSKITMILSENKRLQHLCDNREQIGSNQIENLNLKLKEANLRVEEAKNESKLAIKTFMESQENRAVALDKQLQETKANFILVKHECCEKDKKLDELQTQLDQEKRAFELVRGENESFLNKFEEYRTTQAQMTNEIATLKVLEKDNEQKDAELHEAKGEIELLRAEIEGMRREFNDYKFESENLRKINEDLRLENENCRARDQELLDFTNEMTEKNSKLQVDYSTLQMKLQKLECEEMTCSKAVKGLEEENALLKRELSSEKSLRMDETKLLTEKLAYSNAMSEKLSKELEFQRGENLVLKRKLEMSVKEMTKELSQCRTELENYERESKSSESGSINIEMTDDLTPCNVDVENKKTPTPPLTDIVNLDRQELMQQMIKLQRMSVSKSEKIDFLEEHIQTILRELQKKTKLLQNYMVREQSGALSSATMDKNKFQITKSRGIMSSMYRSKVSDKTLTLELSMEINRKLQAVLEDALLKNITLKENVETLGAEIERIKKERS